MKIVLSIALAFLAAASLSAQTATHVTATVRDSSSIPYSFATVSTQLIPAGTNPTINGAQISATARTQATINGVINFDLWPTNQISPAGSQWQITVCESPGILPPLGTGSQCFNLTTTITGTSQDLSTAMNALAPALTNIAIAPPITGVSFALITSGTNSSAAMVVGTGASLTVSGSGTINATTLNGNTFPAPGPIGGTTPAAATFTTIGSTVATGTAPLSVASTTLVTNLHAATADSAGSVTGQIPISQVGSAGLSSTSPLAIATTGAMTCTTCATTTNGGALSGTAPVTVSAAGAIGCATCTVTIASGTKALATGAISSGTCTAAQTATATGTLTTDTVMVDFNADPTGVTGFVPSVSGILTLIKYPTADTVNIKECNLTNASITPGAITLNFRVVR